MPKPPEPLRRPGEGVTDGVSWRVHVLTERVFRERLKGFEPSTFCTPGDYRRYTGI